MSDKLRTIVITDGDKKACKAVEKAGHNLGLRTISASRGNPTYLSGAEIVELMKKAPHDPVLVMVDDCGNAETGEGEKVLEYLANHPKIDIIGVVAVAANQRNVAGVAVDFSIDREGALASVPVNKEGNQEAASHHYVEGDTVDIINQLDIPLVVGIGDIGKMKGRDSVGTGAKITTRAIEEILKRSGIDVQNTH